MEALLSLAFDNLSSFDGPKIRKGLRQVEGLLAQICLSSPKTKQSQQPASSSSASAARHCDHRDDGAAADDDNDDDDDDDQDDNHDHNAAPPPKNLAQLSHDPAFREFFKLQEGFEWNVAMRLINTLDRLMAKGSDGQNDLLILSALDLTQGVLLLHPPSKQLFSREQNMNLLLDLLEPYNCPAIQSATLLTLVVALIDTPSNARAFEGLDGLMTITSLFKSRNTAREVKLKLVEFLYFYLMPESPPTSPTEKREPGAVPASSRALPRHAGGGGQGHANTSAARGTGTGTGTLTTEEKQQLLSRHLSSVEDLVKDLRNLSPFGGMVC